MQFFCYSWKKTILLVKWLAILCFRSSDTWYQRTGIQRRPPTTQAGERTSASIHWAYWTHYFLIDPGVWCKFYHGFELQSLFILSSPVFIQDLFKDCPFWFFCEGLVLSGEYSFVFQNLQFWVVGSQTSKHLRWSSTSGTRPSFTFENYGPSSSAFLIKWTNLAKENLELWCPLWGICNLQNFFPQD